MNTCKKQNIFVRLFSRARLPTLASSGPVGVCLAARGALQTKRNGPIFCVQSCALVQPLHATYALPCLSDYGLWAAALERARHPCVPTVSVVVREADERTDSMLGEERNLPAVASYWRTARSSDSTSDRSDSSLSLSAA